jgi:hypothetical protein
MRPAFARVALVALTAATTVSCGISPDYVQQDESQVILRINNITAIANGEDDSAFLTSDVSLGGSIVNDNAVLTVQALLKNPALSSATPSDVLLDRYDVVYKRSDGLNTQGVDVPFSISSGMNLLVPASDAGGDGSEAAIIAVRHQAKTEPPLRNLRLNDSGLGGESILTVYAEITVYGRTTAGQRVQATGRLQIVFADFADEEN